MMRPRILIVHGLHTNDDAGWMTTLRRAFAAAGFAAQVWTYGYAHALTARWQNPGRAKQLARLIRPGDIVVGHSNGACLTWMAASLGAPIGGAVLINPALDRGAAMPRHVPWVNLYPNRGDVAVKIARIFPKHPWGDQGRAGLAFNDPRYLTRYTDEGCGHPHYAPPVFGHSAVLEPAPLARWRQVFVHDVERRLAAQRLPEIAAEVDRAA